MRQTEERKLLRARWTSDLTTAALDSLRKHPIDRTAFPFPPMQIAGQLYIDLRGIRPAETILHMKSGHIDFSYLTFEGYAGIGLTELSDCRLIGCTYEGNLSEKFTNCDFLQSKMRRFQAIYGTKFNGCGFHEADLANADCSGVEFVNCDFGCARFQRAQFFECVFDSCRFENAIFGNGAFPNCTFRNLKESLTWIDLPDEVRVRKTVPGASVEIEMGKMWMGGVTFEC